MCFFKTVSFKTILHIMKKLFLKYLFEFFVLVFGITLSFYLQEYGEDLNSIQKQKEGLTRILEDLTSDEAIFKLTLMSNKNYQTIAGWSNYCCYLQQNRTLFWNFF